MIKALPKVISRGSQIDWRRPEKLLRMGIFPEVITTASAAKLLANHIALQQPGYLSVALTALPASGSTVLPVFALSTVRADSTFLVPSMLGW